MYCKSVKYTYGPVFGSQLVSPLLREFKMFTVSRYVGAVDPFGRHLPPSTVTCELILGKCPKKTWA
jgi:hypothetical protein